MERTRQGLPELPGQNADGFHRIPVLLEQDKLAVVATPTWPASPIPSLGVSAVFTQGHLDRLLCLYISIDCPTLEVWEVLPDGSMHARSFLLIRASLSTADIEDAHM